MDLISHFAADFHDCFEQRRPESIVEPIDFIRLERGSFAVRVQARGPQNLIRIGVANTGNEIAARQDALDLAAERPQPLAEVLQVQP